MSQNINYVPNSSRLTVRQNMNKAFESLSCNYYGAIDPSTITGMVVYPGFTWADSYNDLFKIRNGANNGWTSLFVLSTGRWVGGGGVGIHIGSIHWFLRTTAPNGYVIANGETLIRSEFPELWQEAQDCGLLVSEATWQSDILYSGYYSSGNGTTTFRRPNLLGTGIRSTDMGRGLDPGRTPGTYQVDAFQGHWFEITGGNGAKIYPTSTGFSDNGGANGASPVGEFKARTIVTDGVNGTPRVASETRMKNIAFLPCIKY